MSDIHANTEDVKFSHEDAQALITASNNAATAIDGQAGSRRSWRATGQEEFRGYFSTLFRSNGEVQLKDASELAAALRGISTVVGALQKAADAEQQRRQKARDWEEQQQHKNFLEKGLDDVSHLWGGNEPPVPPAAPQLHQTAPKPPTGSRDTPPPGSGGGSSGTSSAVPSNLTSFASSTVGGDHTLSTHLSSVQKAYSAFTNSCGWGSLDASGVLTGFQQFLAANADEVKWANTIAAAFEKAGSAGSVCTLSNQALSAALQAAHVSATRTDLKIDMPSVLGGAPTSGFSDDPVNATTGNFTEPETDLDFPGATAELFFGRTYNSASGAVGAFGPGWSSWAESRLNLGEAEARWVLPDGRNVVFPREADGWARGVNSSYWLVRDGDGLLVTDNAGGRWSFTGEGRLEFFDRGPGTRVDAMYQADGRFVGLVHERGRAVELSWAEDRIVEAGGSDGRRVSYEYDDQGRLVAVAGPKGRRRYVWGRSGLIEQVVDGDGVVEVVNGYDAQGRVAWQRSPFGRTSRYVYLPGGVTEVADVDGERANTWIADDAGRLIGAIDSDGRRQSYAWDAHGNMVSATDRLGRRTAREYDERGRLVHEVTATGADLQYGYDAQDRVITVVVGAADGSGTDAVTRFEYADDGRNPALIIDPTGGRTALVWDRGLLTEVTDPAGVVLRFGYDAHGELTTTTNAVGDVATLERDEAGRVTAAITPLGNRTTYSYDEAGRLVARRDPDGAVWRFEYTAAGRLSAQIAPDGGRTEIEFGETGEEALSRDPLGRVTARTLDDLGNLASVRLPDGSTWSYTHDALSRLVETVDPNGGVWALRYDADGAPSAAVDPTGVTRSTRTNPAENSVTVDDGLMSSTLTRDALGRPRTVTSSSDDTQTYVYDAAGRVIEILDPEGGLTLIRRDAAGRPAEVVDPAGVTTRYGYDACGRLTQVIGADGAVTTREYDADSRLVRQVLPTGDEAWARYDACGRLTQVHQPGSGTARYSYDACGRVVSARDRWWGIRRFAYDQAGQLIAVTNGLGGVTRYEYDANGRPVAITDPSGGVVRRAWNGLDRLVSEVDQLGRATTAGYDAAGRQLWQEAPDGHRLSFGYDASGRNVSAAVDGATICTVERDFGRRIVTVDDRTGAQATTRQREWDRAGRLVRDARIAAAGEARGLSWRYDAAGRRTELIDAFGRRTSYGYDLSGRLVEVRHPELGTVTLEYDAAGRLIAATAEDQAGQRTEQRWQWADGQIVAHSVAGASGASRTDVARDAEGRITAIDRDGAVTHYGYDAAEQLVQVITDGPAQSWTFDANGRLTEHTDGDAIERYDVDAAGQLLAVHHADGTTTTHEYDRTGRRVRTVLPGGARRDYRWSATGWLTGLTDAAADGSTSTIALHVDAAGQLTAAGSAEVWWDSAAAVPTLVGVGGAPVLPLGGVTGVSDRWAVPGWRGVRADVADPWRVEPALGLPGGLGLTATGTLTLAASAGFDPLEWVGARAYDPSSRGFLSTDPLLPVVGAGWAGNPYSYAGNNPLAFSDPTGLHPLTDDELRAQTKGWLSDAWDATKNWWGKYGDYVVAGLVIAGGIAVMATGVGGPIGGAIIAGALINGGVSIGTQKLTSGQVSWGQVGVSAAVGAVGGGVGAGVSAGLTSAATSLGATETSSLVATTGARVLGNETVQGVISGGVGNAAGSMTQYGFDTKGHGSVGGYLEQGGIGFATGAATSGLTSAASNKVGDLVESRTYVPQHAEGIGRHALPVSVTVAQNVTTFGTGAAGAAVTDVVTGERDPRTIAGDALGGGIQSFDVHESATPRHAAAN